MFVGMLLTAAALVLTSWVTSLWQRVLLNGLLLSIGAALIGNLVVNITLSKWFVSLRGRSIAIAAMDVSLAGVVLTPAVTLAIDLLGWRETWRLIVIMTVTLIVPAALLMRSSPESHGLLPDGAVNSTADSAIQADLDRSFTRAEALRNTTFY